MEIASIKVKPLNERELENPQNLKYIELITSAGEVPYPQQSCGCVISHMTKVPGGNLRLVTC